jgi:hypothetical protein
MKIRKNLKNSLKSLLFGQFLLFFFQAFDSFCCFMSIFLYFCRRICWKKCQILCWFQIKKNSVIWLL